MIIDLHDQVTISPALPLRRVATYNASALPLELINIPDAFGDAELTGVGVSIVNADGLEISAPCVRRGDQWRVAFAASCVPTYGFVERGVKVTVSVREDSVDRDIVLGVGDLEVMRSAPSAEPGDPSKGYVTKGSDIFVKSQIVDGVQHFVKQTMEYDEEMHAWGATWTGDYILEDGEFIPYEAPTGGGVTTAAVTLALLLAPFVTSAITATKEYVDRKDGEIAQAATNYTDSATNGLLRTEEDPTVPAWAKKELSDMYANFLYQLLNRDFFSKDANINAPRKIYLTDASSSVTVGKGPTGSSYPYSVLGRNRFEVYGEDYNHVAHYRQEGVKVWPWWDDEAEDYAMFLFPTNSNGGTFALTSDIPGETSNIVTKAYVEGLGISSEETDPTIGLTNGTIYVKGSTITPLTSHQSLSDYVPTSRTVNSKPLSSNVNLDASDVGATTPADVTAAIREQSLGGIWDAELEVWWTPRMRNGNLTYEATTNVNLNAVN